jgi:DNA-binding response OmpR family regulator
MKLTLNHGAFLPRVAENVDEAVASLDQWRPQLAVIDMDAGGAALLDSITARPPAARVPVVALTRMNDLKARIGFFNKGADDVLTLPFAPEELLARVVAVCRRAYGSGPRISPTVKVGDLTIDVVNRRVNDGHHDIPLTSLELGLLYLLAANAGQPLSRDEILNWLWGTDYVADSNVVDRHIRSLRLKLRNNWRRPRYIFTVPGRGYSFSRAAPRKPAERR